MIHHEIIHRYNDTVFKRQAHMLIWVCWAFRDYEPSVKGLEMCAVYEAEARRRGLIR